MTSCLESSTPRLESVPARLNIVAYRGDSLGLQIRVWQDADKTVPADLSHATIRAQVRPGPDSAGYVDFESSIDGNAINLALLPKSARELPDMGVWDCEIDWESDDQHVQTVASGMWRTEPDASHP